MTTEQRLQEALHSADDFEPSPDLFARVERSLAEDRAHRRRLVRNATAAALVVAFCVLFIGAFITTGSNGRLLVPRWVLELLENLILIGLTLTLGPSIRRFGRNYVDDVFHVSPSTGQRVLYLLDTAYYLVFAGVILTTVSLTHPGLTISLQGGLEDAAERFGNFLLAMGILHALTLAVLPVIGLIFSSTRWRVARQDLGADAPPPSEPAVKAEAIVKSIVILIVALALGGAVTILMGFWFE